MFDSGVPLAAAGTSRLAGLIEQNHSAIKAAECEQLVLTAAWADAHEMDSGSEDYQPLVQRACAYGGSGTPEISEYCAVELGALIGTGLYAARALLADALDLRWRLPRLWGRVQTGGVRAWQARKIAQATRPLSWEACADVDYALADLVGMMPWPRFAKILEAAVLEADPELAAERAERARRSQDVWAFESEDGLKTIIAKANAGDVVWLMATINRIADILHTQSDTGSAGERRARALGILGRPAEALALLMAHKNDPGNPDIQPEDDHQSLSMRTPLGFDPVRARPKVVLHFHLSEAAIWSRAMVRPGHGTPCTLDQLVEFLAGTGCSIKIVPVVDPAEAAPVDGYEIPQYLRTAVRYRQVADVFPFGVCVGSGMDLDHTERYVSTDYGGPPGQTRLGNLGPLARPNHRAVTHGGWAKRQPEPGYFVHRSPNGHVWIVTNHGTLALGRADFGAAVWEAAG